MTFEEVGGSMLLLSKRAIFGHGEMENSRLSWYPETKLLLNKKGQEDLDLSNQG